MWRKHLADALSAARCALSLGLVWLGFSRGAAGFPLAVAMLLMAWITDSLDGPLARSSGVDSQTWIGAHDLQFDVAMGTAALIYLQGAGFVDGRFVVAYLLVWAIVFWRLKSLPKSFGALFQAPIYVWFVWTSLHQVPQAGLWFVLYVVAYIVFTWKDFVHTRLPEFFRGLQQGPNTQSRGEH